MLEIYADNKTLKSLAWVYAHGRAETIFKTDMVGVDKDCILDLRSLAEGIYHCNLYNKSTDMFEEGLFFFWYPKLGPIESEGLIVCLSDIDSVQFAVNKYVAKAELLDDNSGDLAEILKAKNLSDLFDLQEDPAWKSLPPSEGVKFQYVCRLCNKILITNQGPTMTESVKNLLNKHINIHKTI